MTWFGSWFGATAGGGGGGGISFPIISQATSAESIRDQIIALIEAIVPTHLAGTRFRAYRNEGKADFVLWSESNPAGAYRRFRVREINDRPLPDVSNTDYDAEVAVFEIAIAYAQSGRAGGDQALDRDDHADEDYFKINAEIGWVGKPNFTAPTGPDATPLGAVKVGRVEGTGIDFLMIRASFRYYANVQG